MRKIPLGHSRLKKRIVKFVPITQGKYQELLNEKSKLAALTAAKQNEIELRDKTIRTLARNIRRGESYQAWIANTNLEPETLESQRKKQAALAYRPLISIIIPTYNTPKRLLQECLNSIYRQTYDNWEICIADDASTLKETKECIVSNARSNQRIKYTFRTKNGHIAVASNTALVLVSGEYVALMDHDDTIDPNALFEVVKLLNDQPLDFVYSDSDKIKDGKLRIDPNLKPDWSPEFLMSTNYINHFAVIRKSLLDDVKGFRIGTEGAQDWDLYLRLSERTNKIGHVPKVLYHWRLSKGSTAGDVKAKPYVKVNQKRVLEDAVRRRQQKAAIVPSSMFGCWWPKYELSGKPLISIIIPTKDKSSVFKYCIDSIFSKTTYTNYEVVVIDTGSTEESVWELHRNYSREHTNYRVIEWTGIFNYSEVCNLGVQESKGDYILLLNNDTEVITRDWIQGLLGYAQQEAIGAVGCKLRYPNGFLQHSGIGLGILGVAGHTSFAHEEGADDFAELFTQAVRNLSAITAACCMMSRDKFEAVGGFDTKLRVTFNDVDLCLKLGQKGWRNVYLPFVELYHHESLSVGQGKARDGKELAEAAALMRKRWGEIIDNDPYYNPNLTLKNGFLLLKEFDELMIK